VYEKYTPENTVRSERDKEMSDSTGPRRRIAGYNQFVKLVRRGKAVKVYLANDADVYFSEGVMRELSVHKNVVLDVTRTSDDLAAMVGVEVPTAVVTEVAE
jgi:ribosomal protein L7Ae-like RNA K-turn-binding protein